MLPGHLFKCRGGKKSSMPAANSKSYDGLQVFGLVAPDYFSFEFESRETAHNLTDSENKLNLPCRTQTVAKLALAIVAPFFGTAFLVT